MSAFNDEIDLDVLQYALQNHADRIPPADLQTLLRHLQAFRPQEPGAADDPPPPLHPLEQSSSRWRSPMSVPKDKNDNDIQTDKPSPTHSTGAAIAIHELSQQYRDRH
jgi:hypothetical protein